MSFASASGKHVSRTSLLSVGTRSIHGRRSSDGDNQYGACLAARALARAIKKRKNEAEEKATSPRRRSRFPSNVDVEGGDGAGELSDGTRIPQADHPAEATAFHLSTMSADVSKSSIQEEGEMAEPCTENRIFDREITRLGAMPGTFCSCPSTAPHQLDGSYSTSGLLSAAASVESVAPAGSLAMKLPNTSSAATLPPHETPINVSPAWVSEMLSGVEMVSEIREELRKLKASLLMSSKGLVLDRSSSSAVGGDRRPDTDVPPNVNPRQDASGQAFVVHHVAPLSPSKSSARVQMDGRGVHSRQPPQSRVAIQNDSAASRCFIADSHGVTNTPLTFSAPSPRSTPHTCVHVQTLPPALTSRSLSPQQRKYRHQQIGNIVVASNSSPIRGSSMTAVHATPRLVVRNGLHAARSPLVLSRTVVGRSLSPRQDATCGMTPCMVAPRACALNFATKSSTNPVAALEPAVVHHQQQQRQRRQHATAVPVLSSASVQEMTLAASRGCAGTQRAVSPPSFGSRYQPGVFGVATVSQKLARPVLARGPGASPPVLQRSVLSTAFSSPVLTQHQGSPRTMAHSASGVSNATERPSTAVQASNYKGDQSDELDGMFAAELQSLDPQLSPKLMLRRLERGIYEIDGRRVSVFQSTPALAVRDDVVVAPRLMACEEGVQGNVVENACLPLSSYISQAAYVAASVGGSEASGRSATAQTKSRKRNLTFGQCMTPTKPGDDTDIRLPSMRIAVEHARVRDVVEKENLQKRLVPL
eukprot:TRINITY_DN10553_c0_g1_i1.p1 TRINITY_DN10553_c0_g1~~TRINITY_DN10553_c0_g1_i1.p1  ORF type:complete len:760 (-),score=98.95 TRINITY_DN10553_c0_g1_i1:188-2467(-)